MLTPTLITDEEALLRHDAWQNLVTAVGTGRDKSTHTTLALDRLGPLDGERYWRADGVAAAIVERLIVDGLRPGWDLELTAKRDGSMSRALSEQIEGRLLELDAARASDGERSALLGLFCSARAIAGAALIPRLDDLRPLSEPLDPARLEARKISHFTLLDCRELSPLHWRVGGDRPGVELWQAHQRTEAGGVPLLTVHASRLIRAHGDVTLQVPSEGAPFPGWPGDSCFVRVIEHLRRWCGGNAAAGAILDDFSQMIYTIDGLSNLRGKQSLYDLLLKRLEALELGRSVVRGVVLGTGETAHRETTTLTGFAETLDRIALPLASAAQYPVEVLFGRQAAGLNATGEGALRVYDQRVDSWRGSDLRPVLTQIYRLLLAEAGEDPDAWRMAIQFRELRQPTRAEDMAARLARAQIDAIEVGGGWVSQEEVAQSRHGGDSFGWETVIAKAAPDPGQLDDDEIDVDVSDLGGPSSPGLAELTSLQTAYNDGQLSRGQALAALRVVYGLVGADADAALGWPPESTTTALAPVPTL